MSHHRRQERRKLVQQQLAELRASMPMSPNQLGQLLDYLEANPTECDGTTKLTEVFLDAEKLDKDGVRSWLAKQAAVCDCEVAHNLKGLALALEPPVPPVKMKNAPRDLRTTSGWDLSKLPAPWRIGNLYAAAEPIQLQIGKKGGCTVQIIEAALPAGDQAADEYWSKLWYARTNLPERGPLRISHASLQLPTSLRSTVVRAPQWTPVYAWIIPVGGAAWHVEIRTESNRVDGDLAQIAALISGLTGSSACVYSPHCIE